MSTKHFIIFLAFIGIILPVSNFAQEGQEKLVIKSTDEKGKEIKLRSNLSEPLIVVDGIERKKSYLDENVGPDQIKSINVYKGEKAITKFGKKGTNGVVEVFTKAGNANSDIIPNTDNQPNEKIDVSFAPKDAIIFVDGKQKDRVYLSENLTVNDIESVNVFKGEKAIEKFGERGKAGVIDIITKDTDMQRQHDQSMLDNQTSEVIAEDYNLLFLVDGKIVAEEVTEQINTDLIKKIDVIKDAKKIAKYTDGDYDGMVMIELKSKS